MKITPDLELNVAEAMRDPNMGPTHAAVLLLCYDLADENRFVLGAYEDLLKIYKERADELLARCAEICQRIEASAA